MAMPGADSVRPRRLRRDQVLTLVLKYLVYLSLFVDDTGSQTSGTGGPSCSESNCSFGSKFSFCASSALSASATRPTKHLFALCTSRTTCGMRSAKLQAELQRLHNNETVVPSSKFHVVFSFGLIVVD